MKMPKDDKWEGGCCGCLVTLAVILISVPLIAWWWPKLHGAIQWAKASVLP